MASAEELLGLLSFNDLARFEQGAQASDPYGIAGQALFNAPINYSQFSPMETGVTAFGKAFLSGLLQNYGRNQVAEQVSSVVGALPQLNSDPYSVLTPEGVDSEAFNMLRGTAILNKARSEIVSKSEKAASARDMLKTILGEGIKAGVLEPSEAMTAFETGKLPEKLQQAGAISSNPNSAQYKIDRDKFSAANILRKEILGNPQVAGFTDVKNRLLVLQKAASDPSSIADLDYVYGIAKILDPGSVVRESEGQTIIDSNSIPGATLGYLNKALSGESALNREALYNLAKRHYQTRQKAINSILDDYTEIAKRQNLNPLDALPFSKESLNIKLDLPNAIENIVKNPPKTELETKAALQKILTEMKDPNTSIERKAALKKLANSLVQMPVNESGVPRG